MQSDILLIGIFITIAVTVSAILWYRLRRHSRDWQAQAAGQEAHLQTCLEAVCENLETLTETAHRYPPQIAPPYQTTAQVLHQRLPAAREAYETASTQFAALHATLHRPLPHPLAWLPPLVLWHQCRYWRRRCETLKELEDAAQTMQGQVNHLLERHRTLQAMPLKVARQVKGLQRAIGESLETGRELKAQGVHGEPLEAALTQVQTLKRELLTLPNYLLQGTETAVMNKATQQVIITSWQTVERLTHPIDTQADKFQRWRSKYTYLHQSLDTLEEHIQSAAKSLMVNSQHIVIDAIAVELHQAQRNAQTLQETFPTLHVEDFDDFQQQVRGLIEHTKKIWERSETLSEHLARLQGTLQQNTTMLEQLETEMDAMAHAKLCPIIWGPYHDELLHLRKLHVNTGALTDTWTQAELDGHMRIADKVNQKVLTLFHKVRRLQTKREALIRYLQRPGLALQPSWLKQAEDLSHQTSQYAPKNWPQWLEVTEILEKAQDLAQARRESVPAHLNDAVAAQELSARTEATRQLLHHLETFENRLQHIANTLILIQQTERNAEQTLDTVHQRIVPLRQQLKDLKPLPTEGFSRRSPATKSKRTLKKLHRRGRRLASKLQRQNRGTIQDKARAVDEWAAACRQAFQDLPRALQTEIAYLETTLRDEIQALKKWAPLDNDPVLHTAQQPLNRRRSHRATPVAPSSPEQLEALSTQAMNLLQEREALANALSSLQAQVKAPLEKAFETLGKLGPEARREINALKALKARAEGTWPALACDIQTAEAALSAAVKNEEQIQRSGRTVQHVRQQLDTTRQQYQAAISEAQAQRKRIRQAQDEQRNALNRLARWQGQLKAYQQSHREDPAIREAVQTRLNEIAQAMQKAQRRHNKPMSSAEAAQVLQALWTLAHQDIALPGSRRTIKIKAIEKGH